MSDCLSELRRELVDAHARYGERSAIGRVVRPRAWRPVLAVGTVAACVVAIALTVGTLRQSAPSGRLGVLAVVNVGGQPNDAAAGFGSLWISKYGGTLVRVDPATRRVLQEIPLGTSANSVAVDATGVWVATEPLRSETSLDNTGVPPGSGRLLRIEPRDGRIVARASLGTWAAVLAAGDRALWVVSSQNPDPRIKSVDPRTAQTITTRRIGSPGVSVAAAGSAVWTLGRDGSLALIDPRSGRVVRMLPGVTEPLTGGGAENALAADSRGVWVISPAQRAIVRVVAGRMVRRIPIPASTLPVLARSGAALWVVQEERLGHYRLGRIDADRGALTQTVDLGLHRPAALVAAAGGLWVVATDGTALLVGTDAWAPR
jgi:hypothetical protein